MADIASLGIRVTTQGVPEAERSLQSLAKAGGNAATSVQRLAKDTEGTLRESGKTWRQFVGERMGDYMRLEGGHAGAMKRIAAEWKDYKAGLAGVGAAATQAAPAARALSEGLGKVAPAMQQAARSTKELQAATRQLPMQFTDIVTSLASGQRPLQVLMQQGGQLKDVFGGIGPAARAMGGYIAGLINPATLAGAAIVGLAVALDRGNQESVEFNKALILTGNYAGLTASQLATMAARIGEINGLDASRAAETLAKVAATGKFTADQVELVARTAEQMQQMVGQSVEETIRQFERMGRDPVDAVLQLNDQYHFLTKAQLEHIRLLQDQGRNQEAATEAFRAFASDIDTKHGQITANLGYIERAWASIRTAIVDTKNAWLDFGRAQSTASLQGDIDMWKRHMALNPNMSKAERDAFQSRIDGAEAQQKALAGSEMVDAAMAASRGRWTVDSATERARQEFERSGLRYATERQRMERDIADARKQGAAAGASDLQIEQRIAAIRASYAKKAPKERKSDEERAREALNQRFTSQNASLEREVALFGDRSRAAAAAYDVQASGLDKVNPKLAESLQANAKWLDQLDEMKAVEGVWADIADEYADANKRKAETLGQLTDDMQFEIDLLGKSAIEQARMIALRRARVDAASAEGQEIIRLSDAYVRLSEQQRLLDDVRGSTEDMFASFIDGSKSASEAFEDFAKDLQRIAARLLAQKAVEWLFSSAMFGNSGPNVQAASGGGYTGPTGVWEFASGGYTGPGGQFEPAGVVHKGEVVWSQQDVARAGGVGVVEAMRLGRRGYAAGGVVGGAAAMGGGIRDIVINTPPGSTARTEQRDAGDGSGARDLIVFIENTAKQAVASDIARGGMIAKAGQMAYGWQRQGVSRG